MLHASGIWRRKYEFKHWIVFIAIQDLADRCVAGQRRDMEFLVSTFLRFTKHFMVIRSRRMRWAGHVALTGWIRNAYSIRWETLKGRNNSEYISVDGKIILKCILGK
jgi:hypothetical protein